MMATTRHSNSWSGNTISTDSPESASPSSTFQMRAGRDASAKDSLSQVRAARKYPRKRAVTACQFCRTRRIKCSNERPSCASCLSVGTPCIYTSFEKDHSSFDPASLLILDKLDTILTHLETTSRGLKRDDCVQDEQQRQSALHVSDHDEALGLLPDRHQSGISSPQNGRLDTTGTQSPNLSAVAYLKIPSGRISPDSILTWPVFQNRFGPEYLTTELLASSLVPEGVLFDSDPASRANWLGMSSDRDIILLVERFIIYVHVKNPFLDTGKLKSYARRMVEEGPQWDAPTCLVLLACALGATVLPLESQPKTPEDKTPILSQESMQKADHYHSLALRRFGILTCSKIKSECHLLSAIYLMYSLKPIRAWNDFLQASCNYLMYQRSCTAAAFRGVVETTSHKSESLRLEQSLYWTCFKSECEMREEMSLPESGLSELHYPYLFPTPPTPLVSEDIPMGNDNALPTIQGGFHAEFQGVSGNLNLEFPSQQSWFYYMTEITLRRIGNRILNAFYHSEPNSWATLNVNSAHDIAQHFELQLHEWVKSLPECLRFDQQLGLVDELRAMAHGRYITIKFWLYRPFIYHFIHTHPADQTSYNLCQDYVAKAMKFCIEECVTTIQTHRHHGTWFGCRVQTCRALIILAVLKSGKIDVPSLWKDTIEQIVVSLKFWENASPDISKAREVIESLYAEVNGGT